jgi:SAM-dependent methyltransferase
MTGSRRAVLWVCAAAVLVAWGWLDPRRRAGLDDAAEARWRATLSKVEEPSVARHRTDATVYLAAALALDRGSDPYAAESPRGWRYVYPPLLAALLRPIASWPVEDAAFSLFLASLAALVLSAVLLARAAGPPRGAIAVGLALLLASPFLVQAFQRGQVTVLLLATQVGAMALLLRGRDFVAGVVLALGVALRLTPLLVAGMVGVAALRRLATPGERLAALRFPAGLLAGLSLWFVVAPAALLGPEKALDATQRWVESTRRLYASGPSAQADLAGEYAIDEFSFKNQGVARVVADVLGGAPARAAFPDGRPRDDRASLRLRVARLAGLVVAGALALAAAALAWTSMRERGTAFRRAFALGVFLPVFATRYAWPTHYVAAVPLLAESLAGARRPWCLPAVLALAAGTLLFYAGHAESLRPLATYGALLLGAWAAAAWFGSRIPGSTPLRDAILDRYPRSSQASAAYRRGRLAWAGFEGLAARLPRAGTVVDLGAGEGLLAHVLVAEAPARRVVAVDHDGARMARLRASSQGLPIEAVAAPMEAYAIPACDGVALVDVMHYLEAPAQDALLRRAHDALRPGGVLVLREPDADGGLRFAWTRLHERLMTGTGWTRARVRAYRGASGWVAALKAAGFAEVEALPHSRMSPYADRAFVARKAG